VGEKINQKMESGDLSRDDIMNEAGELMRKMKDMGGGGQFADMFKTMAKGMGVNIPKGTQFDSNAFAQMEKATSAREKLKARAQARQQQKMVKQMMEQAKIQQQQEQYSQFMSSQEGQSFLMETQSPNHYIYRVDGMETQEKSSIRPSLQITETVETNRDIEPMSASKKKRMKQKAKQQKMQEMQETAESTL